MWWRLYIFMRTFLRKSSFPSWPKSFFQNIFTPTSRDVLNWSLLVDMQLCLKCLQIRYKKRLKIFSWSYQRNRTPSAKHLSHLKLKGTTACFEHDIFHKNMKEKRLWTSPFLQILHIATKWESITDFFRGIIFLQKFQEIVPPGVTF